ncbi:hypothetical protein [Pseudoalteromonas sp. HM-SA03]|uniref:hypothetical protein n=1 Tax=Pseudoalteromonas sp. HM-SA03 TaxID=2029678 RepID=UPI0020D0DD3E|nr:hypothetical protein [Pseudoalteromonas sp. HM-SA03]
MVSDPVASSFIRGVASVLETQHINVLLFSSTADNVGNIVNFVDGLICHGRLCNSKLIEHIANVSKQVVTVDFDLPAHTSSNIKIVKKKAEKQPNSSWIKAMIK